MVSRIKELAEEAKIAIRNIRRDGNKAADYRRKGQDDQRGRTRRTSRTKSRN